MIKEACLYYEKCNDMGATIDWCQNYPHLNFDCEKCERYIEKNFVRVVRCKDCKHKPSGDGANHNVEFPDEICPCQCEDSWYSWVPKDNFFCAWGERKEDEQLER